MRRHDFMTLLGGAAILPIIWAVISSSILVAAAPARGQADAWQLYRREDLGFEVEIPGVPKIEVEEGDKDDPLAKSVDLGVEFRSIDFTIKCEEWRRRVTVDQEIAAQRFGARSVGTKIVGETMFTLNGMPGVEIATDGGINFRVVLVENRAFVLSAFGAPSDNASVRRFFDSFRLLSTGR